MISGVKDAGISPSIVGSVPRKDAAGLQPRLKARPAIQQFQCRVGEHGILTALLWMVKKSITFAISLQHYPHYQYELQRRASRPSAGSDCRIEQSLLHPNYNAKSAAKVGVAVFKGKKGFN